MQRNHRWIMLIAGALLAALILAACGQTAAVSADKIEPAKVEKIEGSEFNRLTLTEQAAQRLAIQIVPVREEQVDGAQRKTIPYAAVIYGLQGETWAYISPAPLTFVRAPITIDHIDGDTVILTDGPDAGTEIVTVGVAELYGADTGVK